ncbi:MAG: hypothetical protein QHG99_06525 [Methanomicrobiales archaeon]|nr:hypothetical protein [Methanomicrobiales archaeon]
MSVSAVVASFFESRILIRFALRERSAGFTSFRVTYTPAVPVASRGATAAARAPGSSKYPEAIPSSVIARTSTIWPGAKRRERVRVISSAGMRHHQGRSCALHLQDDPALCGVLEDVDLGCTVAAFHIAAVALPGPAAADRAGELEGVVEGFDDEPAGHGSTSTMPPGRTW